MAGWHRSVWRRPAILAIGGLCGLAVASPAAAQAIPADTLDPVDQAVEDLDPRATSRRRIDPGNALYSARTQVFKLDPQVSRAWSPILPELQADTHPYFYLGRGVQMIVPRTDYLVYPRAALERSLALNMAPHRDGAFVERIPAGAVFNLIPDTAARGVVTRDRPDPEARLDTRLGVMVDGRVDRAALRPINPHEESFPPAPAPPRRVDSGFDHDIAARARAERRRGAPAAGDRHHATEADTPRRASEGEPSR